MTLEQLKSKALSYVKIKDTYELCVAEVNEELAVFIWKDPQDEMESCVVELDLQGNLLALAQPFRKETGEHLTIDELQEIAEAFLAKEYPEALNYLSLTKVTEEENRTYLKFEQLVEGYPLDSSFCMIEMGNTGRLIDFNYKGYLENPPQIPQNLVSKEPLLKELYEADWQPKLSYLNKDYYSVEQSGLYVVYENPIVYKTFDALEGTDYFDSESDEEELEEVALFLPLSDAPASEKEASIEKVIGIPASMEVVRKSEIDEGVEAIVWQEKDRVLENDQTFDSFMRGHMEDTVKAKVHLATNHLNGFIWFKERYGNLDLSYEQCEAIAVSFIKTYYSEYIPYLQMKVVQKTANPNGRMFFNFPIFVDGMELDGDFFDMSVNKNTGFIEHVMAADIDVATLERYVAKSLITIEQAKKSLKDVGLEFAWNQSDDSDEVKENAIYRFKNQHTKRMIKGINAITGELIDTQF